jgi:hypothetical protein
MNRNAHQGKSATPDELRAQVEATRHELGHTVQALAAKADVRGRAQAKAGQVREQMRERAARAGSRAHVRRRAGDTAGRPQHGPTARARHERAAALAQTARDKRVLAATGAALTCLAVLAGRRRHCHHHGR